MMKVSNFVMTLICIAAAVSLTGGMLPKDGGSAPELYAQAGMPNPWTDQQTMEDAQLAVGFSFQIPKTIGTLKPVCIQTLDADIIQVFYRETEDSEEHVLLRKGFGNEDISGDYNLYSQQQSLDVGGVTVTLKGDGGLICLATWQTGGFFYSLSADPGLAEQDFRALLESALYGA